VENLVKAWRWGAPAMTVAALLLLAWNCAFNPSVPFLAPGPGPWIVFPLPPYARPYSGCELAGAFRGTFVLPEKPGAARLSWRCFTNGEVRVNGTVVPPSGSAAGNWKCASQRDIGPLLRQGTNEISVLVTNRLGPPALSLELRADNLLLTSDETWEVSVSGSDWRPARAASATPRPGKGNDLSLLETTRGAWRRCWPWLCLCAVISLCGAALLPYATDRAASSRFPKLLPALLAAAWALLLLHNFPSMPPVTGFDAEHHLNYVKFIQDHHRLPKAGEGAEMFQPPLYYVLSATLLDFAGCKTFEPAGLRLLRGLSLAIGAATLALVFAGLRLVFPGDWKKPLVGLALAAFLPANVCLAHYPTNETLSALFVTAALCAVLRLLRDGPPGWGGCAVLGIALGLALSSKASAVLALPAVMGALAVKLMERRPWRAWSFLGCLGAPLLICLAIGGWHYLHLWRDYGHPFIGNWDPKIAAAAPWWQPKGYQTLPYYFSFGDSLSRPFLSGLHGFWDGLYSTLWGDGLLSSAPNLLGRPPWNYDLMAVGFVLALVPSALVLTGLVRALAGCWRAANPVWLLFLSLFWLFAFALLAMTLKVPSYAQSKAIYALAVLLPFCAFGALGFEFWAGRGKAARYLTAAALGLWLLNTCASLWIKPHATPTRLASAICRALYLKADSTEVFSDILRRGPGNSQAALWLARSEAGTHPEQALKELELALQRDPANGHIESALASNLAFDNRLDEAIPHARRAVELAPEDEAIAQNLCRLELRHENYQQTVAAARYALTLDPADLTTHGYLGAALMAERQIPEAISHFSAIVEVRPTWAQAQFALGVCLLDQPGRRNDAIAHLREAVRLQPANKPWQTALDTALHPR
jgi:tetratricopeptide (TPR) repeat protein